MNSKKQPFFDIWPLKQNGCHFMKKYFYVFSFFLNSLGLKSPLKKTALYALFE